MIKTNLTTYANLGREVFPWPGTLKGRSQADRAAILADPAAFFGDPINGHDPVPDGARGFGWWTEVDQSPALGIAETYGADVLTVDVPERRWIITRPLIPAPVGGVDAYFDSLETVLVAEIEASALLARHAVYNPDPTKLEIHRRKREMALDIAGGATVDPVAHDYLVEEAALLGVTAADLAVAVLVKVGLIAAAGKAIELKQTAAEIAVNLAKGDEPAMRVAAIVNWT